jgi:inosine-uridine nucleoside N-ribohydrolase
MAKPVVLDMDVGVDDALALMLAIHSPELEVLAVTAVSGNAHVDNTSKNALKVLEWFDVANVRVARGMAKPLTRDLTVAPEYHGRDGLGDTRLPEPRRRLDAKHGVDALVEEVMRAAPRSLTLIATGPLTNVAAAFLMEPSLAGRLRELVIMGGAYETTPYGVGNQTQVAEFNIYVDPEAAKIVFNSGVGLTAVGLDVTTDPTGILTLAKFKQIERARTRSAALITKVLGKLIRKFGSFALHDPMAVAYAIRPSMFKTAQYHVDVETRGELTRGQTVADRRSWRPKGAVKPPNANICVGVDGPRFLDFFFERAVNMV